MQKGETTQAKILTWLGYGFLILNIATGILMLFRIDRQSFGGSEYGPWSIFGSQKIYIAYHVWSIITSLGTGIAWYYQQRGVFFFFLIFLLFLTFYPIFTLRP